MQDEDKTTFPVLPLRDIVVFPHMIVPLFVGREKSIKALNDLINKKNGLKNNDYLLELLKMFKEVKNTLCYKSKKAPNLIDRKIDLLEIFFLNPVL